jgi:hypothetical protein
MNSDDNTPAFGVRVPIGRTVGATDEASAEQTADELDPDLGIPAKDLNIFNAYWRELAVIASEDPRPNTAEEQLADDELYAKCLETTSKPPADVRAERELARARKP